MTKKVIAVLVFLVAIIGALGAYSFNLNKEIIALSELQNELQKQTSREIMSLQSNITSLESSINSLGEEITSQITSVDSRINALSIKVAGIPTIDAKSLYPKINRGVVEVVTKANGTKETTGSGFVFDSQGYIVTAYHVVEDATEVEIIIYDGTVSEASIVGYCPYSDIAVLRLKRPLELHALTLGDSDAVAIGEPVIAIGHPFDLSGTMTSGIVSQKGRYIDIEYSKNRHRWVANLLQCDVAVNFGNSGGPLINSKGEVIGLTIARIDPKEGEGIYYFVSSNKVKRVVLSIIDHGSFDYPWLGINVTDLNVGEARARELNTTNGTRVIEVIAESPAAAAGIKADDIIVAIDEISIRETADLTSYLGENKSPSESVILTIIRDSERLELSVELGKRTS